MTSVATFFMGFAAAFFAIYSGLLLRMKARTRFQTILGILFAVWAIACTKDLVLLLPLSDYQRILKTITVVDGYLLITFIVFLFELTMPGWTTVRRLVLTALPFSFFLIAYQFNRIIYFSPPVCQVANPLFSAFRQKSPAAALRFARQAVRRSPAAPAQACRKTGALC